MPHDATRPARRPRRCEGVLDENLDFQASPGERRVCFEISAFEDSVFFESPR